MNKVWVKLKVLQELATILDTHSQERKYEKEQEAKMFVHQTTTPKNNPPWRDNRTFLPAKVAWAPAPASVAIPCPISTPPVSTTNGLTHMELDTQWFKVQISEEEKAR
jgi:hypothetical protein